MQKDSPKKRDLRVDSGALECGDLRRVDLGGEDSKPKDSRCVDSRHADFYPKDSQRGGAMCGDSGSLDSPCGGLSYEDSRRKDSPSQDLRRAGAAHSVSPSADSHLWDSQRQDSHPRFAPLQPSFRNEKKGKSGARRVVAALFYSRDGLAAAFRDEEAFRQVALLAAIFTPLGLFLGEGFSEKILLITPPFLCLIVELANSAIENAIDLASPEIHPLAKKAKDMGSAMQLVSLVFFALVWGVWAIQNAYLFLGL